MGPVGDFLEKKLLPTVFGRNLQVRLGRRQLQAPHQSFHDGGDRPDRQRPVETRGFGGGFFLWIEFVRTNQTKKTKQNKQLAEIPSWELTQIAPKIGQDGQNQIFKKKLYFLRGYRNAGGFFHRFFVCFD